MNCEQAADLLADRMNELLTETQATQLAAHLAGCPACRAEADALSAIWDDLDTPPVDVPHDRLRARFHAALAAYDERTRETALERFLGLWMARPAFQAALGICLLVLGVVLGRSLPGSPDAELATMREEIRGMSLALLEHQSASERLRGIGSSRRGDSSGRVVDALIETVRNDGNMNVRLAAVEALSGWLDQPEIGTTLLEVLNEQDAPLLQVALAQALLDADVAGSIPVVERLIAREEVDPAVRDYLGATLIEANARPGTDRL